MTAPSQQTSNQPTNTRELLPLRALPPFRSYPILSKEVLVPAAPAPRLVHAIIRLVFAYPAPLLLDPATQSVKVLRPGPYKPRSYTPTPSEPGTLALTIKSYPGGSSAWLCNLPLGSRVTIFGPLPLPLRPRVHVPGSRAVIIALGIGITLGLAAAEKEAAAGRPVLLARCVRWPEERALQTHTVSLQERFPRLLRVREFVSGELVPDAEHGRVDTQALKDMAGDGDGVRFLVVGTKGMMKQLWATLDTIGFPHRTHALIRKSTPFSTS